MSTSIHVLFIEDNPGDARLIKEELRSAASRMEIQLEWVDRLEPGLEWLTANPADAVLLDLSLPDSSGLETLQRVLSHAPDLPVIVMTGQADEEVGVRAVQAGAQDYLIKGEANGRLLARSIQYSIERKQSETAVAALQKRFQALIENAPDGIALLGLDGKLRQITPSTQQILGYTAQDAEGQDPAFLTHPDDLPALLELLGDLIQHPGQVARTQYRFRHKDGSWRWLESTISNLISEPGVEAIVFNYRDITDHKLADLQIRQQIQRLNALREIDRAISSSFDLRITLNTVLSQVIAQLQVDAAVISLLDADEQTFVYAAGQGLRTPLAEAARVPVGGSYAGRVARERQLVKIENLQDQPKDIPLTTWLADENFISYYGVPLIAKGKVIGVLEVFHRFPLVHYPEWLDFLNTLAGQAAIAIENTKLFENLQQSNYELSQAYDATIVGWSRALDLRDKETEGHTLRVTALTMELAQRFGFSEEELLHIRWGALLHDIGKMGVPDNILLKQEPLSGEEWTIMRKHTEYAHDLLKQIDFLKSALDIPYCHHEKWDGTGYPRGLKGDEIPMAARLFAIVDVWDALISGRPYHPAWSKAEALTYIREQSGRHFDPEAVSLFLTVVKER